MLELNKIYCIDVLDGLKQLSDCSIDCVITSPPYWGLRDYGIAGQFGLEKTPEEYVQRIVLVFREVRRVLKQNGTIWLNLGDTYAGNLGGNRNGIDNVTWEHAKSEKKRSEKIGTKPLRSKPSEYGLKPKDLVGIPWRVAFALQEDGWWLRQDIIWNKPNCMPDSVTDRCTKSHEYVFLLSKCKSYYYDADSIKEPSSGDWSKKGGSILNRTGRLGSAGRNEDSGPSKTYTEEQGAWKNRRSVWNIATKPFREAHFALFPEELIEPMIKAGCPKDGLVLDPFIGSGTTGLVARKLLRNYIGFELNPEYVAIANKRLANIPTKLPETIWLKTEVPNSSQG